MGGAVRISNFDVASMKPSFAGTKEPENQRVAGGVETRKVERQTSGSNCAFIMGKN
jgi:hypothetical protein